jgi:hypothetical protein
MMRFYRYFRARPAAILAVSIPISAVVAWTGVDRLAYERRRLEAVEAIVQAGSRPIVPLISGNMAFADPDRRSALARFGSQLEKAAADHRLLVERLDQISVKPDRQGVLMARIAVSGSESDILTFIRIVESGKPAIRFAPWRIARTARGESTIRIDARALALWKAGP